MPDLSVFDEITVTEFVSRTLNVFDSVTVTESVTMSLNTILSASTPFSTTAIAENITINIHGGDLSLSVFDQATATENVSRASGTVPLVRYVDFVNGNDGNAGTSWATAKKNFSSLSGLSSSSIIKVAKTPEPILVTQDALWQDNHFEVRIPDGIVRLIDECEWPWFAAPNITTSLDTGTFKGGTACVLVTPAAAFTTGKICWQRISPFSPITIDLSAYDRITFWMRMNSNFSANAFKVALCSDYDGEVIVDEATIDFAMFSNLWYPITLKRSGGGQLGSAIKSVAIYALVDPGTSQFRIDSFYAATEKLHFNTVIGRNLQPQGGIVRNPSLTSDNADLVWYPIKAFGQYLNTTGPIPTSPGLGRIVQLGAPNQSGSPTSTSNSMRWYNLHERGSLYAPMYSREGVFMQTAATTTPSQDIVSGGQYLGGFNPATDGQEGETFIDNFAGFNDGIRFGSSMASGRLERFGILRHRFGTAQNTFISPGYVMQDCWCVAGLGSGSGVGFFWSSGGYFGTFRRLWGSGQNFSTAWIHSDFQDIVQVSSQVSNSMVFNGTGKNRLSRVKLIGNMNTNAMGFSTETGSGFLFEDCLFAHHFVSGTGMVSMGAGHIFNAVFRRCLIERNFYGIAFARTAKLKFVECIFRDQISRDINFDALGSSRFLDFLNCKLLSTTEISGFFNWEEDSEAKIRFQNDDGVVGSHKIYKPQGTILSEQAEGRTAQPALSMKNNGLYSNLPVVLDENGFFRHALKINFKAPVRRGIPVELSIFMKAESGFTGGVYLATEFNGNPLHPPTPISPALTTSYQQYSIKIGGQYFYDDGAVDFIVLLDSVDTVRKIFLDDFNYV